MRLATIVSLGASTALGVGALIVARVWMPSHTASAQSPPPAAAVGVPVVVASQPIPYGVKLEAKYLTTVKLPAAAAPSGAYASISQILNQQGGPPTAIVPMTAQEPVLSSKLTGVGERATLAALITPGMRAYTVSVNEVSGTGGHVMPGDRVDVLLTRELPGAQKMDGQGEKILVTGVVVQNIRVLAIDQNANPTTATPVVARSATMEVSIRDAEKLALAAQAGTLSLALRKTGEVAIEPARGFHMTDLGAGGGGGSGGDAGAGAGDTTAAPPANAHPVLAKLQRAKHADDGHTVIIVNGAAPTTVQVPAEGGVRGGFL
jgi:pilus assembly protein CpaB